MFCKQFKNIDASKVHVITPDKPNIDIEKIVSNSEFKDNRKLFIYPAVDACYKNHKIILEALKAINIEQLNKIHVLFTVDKKSNVAKLVNKYKLENVCICIGMRQYKELLEIYKAADVFVYPSKIESYGLPLIEASAFGLPILASDLPYAREVLREYQNVKFVNPDDYKAWAKEISAEVYSTKKNISIEADISSWKKFMNIVEEMLQEK